jgi:hypothetical protein
MSATAEQRSLEGSLQIAQSFERRMQASIAHKLVVTGGAWLVLAKALA